jgi:hypothetical protein
MTTKQMTTDLNKKNGTTFVISGTIRGIKIENDVSFDVMAPFVTTDYFGTRTIEKEIAWIRNFPKHVSHKILQNLDRKVRITIELVDDEDHLCQS